MKLALVRHPKPLVATGICYGTLDLSLHPDADGEITSMRRALAGFDATMLWSSPLRRCRLVADVLAEGREMRCDPRLAELNFGAWEGLAWDAVPRAALDAWARDPWSFAAPGGESGADLVARVASFHAELVSDGRDGIIVSHGGPLKVLRAMLQGQVPDLLAPPPAIGSVTFV